MDGLSLSAVVLELSALCGGRVEKLQQPERDELLISIHTAGGSCRLLISASPENCRITLSDEKKQSPAEAPAFLMLMRKYLTGARITGIEQPNGDRIVKICFETYSELHDVINVTLICEIMGKVSNIILTDGEGYVIDAIRRVSPATSPSRPILPRMRYEYPPSKEKRVARLASAEEFASVLREAEKPDSALSAAFYGLSPAVAGRLLAAFGYPACGAEAAGKKLADFYSEFYAGCVKPCIVLADGHAVCTLPFLPEAGTEYREYPTMSEAVNDFYRLRALEESVKRRTAGYERAIKNAIQKLERKIGIYYDAMTGEEEIERYKRYGELLTANLYLLPARGASAMVTDYYSDPPRTVEIPLDPTYSPADNAKRYFTKYRKAKLAAEHAAKMTLEAESELDYLEGLLYTLGCCEGEAELNEIKAELIAGKYVKDESAKDRRSGKKAAAPKLPASKPYSFVSRDGVTILVGKNNRQNDALTLKTALPDEVWLHAQNIHGSHVIIRTGGEVPDNTLYDAAMLAAYYSKARGSSNVPVDYTLAKYVKKPSGANPGMVIYTHQRTVYVTPDEEHIRSLSNNNR